MRVLSQVLNVSAEIVLRSIQPDNRIHQCISSGSKGKTLNEVQIHATVGLQTVGGQRPRYRTNPRGRSLPKFNDTDKDHPIARGFCVNSYTSGLTPVEVFFHCAGGREGMIDTACKTAETGYLQRRMAKILESEHACWDTSVRDSHGSIITTRYGGTGMSCQKLLKSRVPILGMTGTVEEVARQWCNGDGIETEVLSTCLRDVRECLLMYHARCPTFLYIPFQKCRNSVRKSTKNFTEDFRVYSSFKRIKTVRK